MMFFSPFGHAQTLIYSWRDRGGKIHIVDELNKVPIQYRDDMRIYRLSSKKEGEKPRSKASSKPVTKVKEVEEETEETSREERPGEEIGAVRTSITQLEDRLEELREERRVKWRKMIRKRAHGKAWIRERRETEEIDREIETLTNEMGKKTEALRSLEEGQSLRGGE
jgi:predicted RNase H-like nuclease (RuvC/YqgF family)